MRNEDLWMRKPTLPLVAIALLLSPIAASAASPRDTLSAAAFSTPNAAAARQDVDVALAEANAELAKNPADGEAQLQQALAIGYRAKLTKSAADAKQAHKLFNALIATRPRDPEAQLAIAGWNLDAIADVGAMLARMVLGASKADGLAALDRSVTLGAGHALFPAYAALIRTRLDPTDPAAVQLARQAVAAPAPTALDKLMQVRAASLLKSLNAGNGAASATLARRLLPFGTLAA